MKGTEQRHDIVVIGRSCRLPGSSSVEALWSNLLAERCSVTEVPDNRFQKAKFGHPRAKEPGKSYTWAAGVLDDLWSFDPSVFGISPREAEQMDPQQRLLLELTWEAIEDSGIPASELAGTNVGVFVGASSPEYTVIRNTDIASGDAYTATGGALSIISNRISHAFDLRGPSFTVDTACSSSLVALHQAMEALNSGRIDTALVGGINLLMTPFGFVVFSQASMLSPTGRCHTFDASADGYVRSEGGVVFLLRRLDKVDRERSPVYARIAASGVNSDGRTNGIALPSRFSQKALLKDVYARAGISPAQVAFVEAHGTGTRVGDPIEASTIGEVLGQGRPLPLPIGSIKSNIGHLEPASGLAGMLKAMLALEHDLLPPTVNFSEPNPDIPFDELNLAIASSACPLPRGTGTRYAGVNSFGFGGTNAHVVIGDPPAAPPRPASARASSSSDQFAVTGATRAAVRDLARAHAERVASESSETVGEIAAAAVHRREMLGERLVVSWASPRDLARKLERIADKEEDVPGTVWGTVTEPDSDVAFVFSGNGGQWAGMGRGAYETNRAFRGAFDEVDTLFDAKFGWSVTEALFASDLEQRLPQTSVAQPLIFSVQIATARALAADGLTPNVVLGHSVGEIAAAAVSGALTLPDAVGLIHARSLHQEIARDTGRMGVIVGSREAVEAHAADYEGVEIAAVNSPRTFTVAGPTDAVKAFGQGARKRRMAFRQLDLDYPFHCRLVDGVREPLLADLKGLKPRATRIPMISTVTGEAIEGAGLDAHYWWRNVREPVRFAEAVEAAARGGARVFVEIGPRSVLLSNITETLEPTALPFAALGVLEKREDGDGANPIRPAVVTAWTRGARIERDKLFGADPGRPIALPSYGWQKRDIAVTAGPEAVGFTLDTKWHRLLGARTTADGTEWTGLLDTAALPELGDHVVGHQAILPGAAFCEMALSVARQWFETDTAALLDIEITQPLVLEKDRSREVKARLSTNTNTVEILSRPRLAKSAWQLHAVSKITAGSDDPIDVVLPPRTGEVSDGAAVYRAAESVGLHYGPEFRLVRAVTRVAEDAILVDLLPSAPHGDYRIDPARLDACFHGLFTLFAGLDAGRRGMAYIPVRFGHTRVVKEGGLPASALIELRRVGERSMLADFTLFDAAGTPVARLDEARFQAARVKRIPHLSERALVQHYLPSDGSLFGRSGVAADTDAILAGAAAAGLVLDAAEPESAEQLLLEGWATAAAYEIARAVDPSRVIPAGRIAALPKPVSLWLTNLLQSLEGSGLAEVTEAGWKVSDASGLPAARLVLRTVAAEHPNRSAELLLAGALTAFAEDGGPVETKAVPSPATVDGFDLGGWSARAAGDALSRLLAGTGLLSAPGRAVRVLQVGYGPFSHALDEAAAAVGARLTILEADGRRLERAKLALAESATALTVGSDAPLDDAAFDLILSAERLGRLTGGVTLADLRRALAPGGRLVAVEPLPSQFRDLVFGVEDGWFDAGLSADFPLSPLRSGDAWRSELTGAGFAGVAVHDLAVDGEGATLLVAGAPAGEAQHGAPRPVALAATHGSRAAALGRAVEAASGGVIRTATPAPDDGVDLMVVATRGDREADLPAIRRICLDIKDRADALAGSEGVLWVVALSEPGRETLADAVTVGVLSFARTLANETSGLTIRRVAVSGAVAPQTAGAILAELAGRDQAETDLLVDGQGCRVLRMLPLTALPDSASHGAARLERGTSGGLSGLTWAAVEPDELRDGTVAIAVEATGLNFRDVMWAMSLLPDDILEDGFAGPTLGLECAGRVTAVGPGVERFAVGDRVIAFAPSAFSTNVVVPEAVVARIPDSVATEAAATIPVAFLTAYYGLVTLAGLRKGEWVLIHGAAGGVGLAAIQIAQARGANIVATAGAREKRDLLRALGVEHVLNSRSTAFADEIRRICPAGADVVLNSLAGEAMERGLSTLKPFGRFIELGKRDYVANTRIGLRPFRRNLSYFGVDVDQLLSDQGRAADVFGAVIRLFEAGTFKPLPYRVFSAAETVDAFRLMQQSGHIGKILLRPPAAGVFGGDADTVTFDPDRTHLVTGGFGGFGLEAALWLADRGVRHLVLTGRSGPASEDAQAVVATLRERGVNLLAAACDVSDADATAALLAEIRGTMPPLAGVIHGAMVLEDSLVANLTAEQFTRVLTPKVEGARHLDRLTDADRLDYFVLFSSITTFVGNPGQAAYVAANGYLEGIARARRDRGVPGLALAWGAISDVGVLARQKGLAEALAKRVGVKAMPAREALDLMAQAMSRGTAGDPVMAVGSLDWSAARRLPALASPTFAALVRDGGVVDAADHATINLQALVASGEPEAVRRQVIDIIIEEIAAVLRIPKGDVSTTKRLAEIGLDSLMAIELATALQERLELGSPPTGSVGTLTVPGLAEHLLSFVGTGGLDEEARVTQALNEKHGSAEIEMSVLTPVLEAVSVQAQGAKGLMH